MDECSFYYIENKINMRDMIVNYFYKTALKYGSTFFCYGFSCGFGSTKGFLTCLACVSGQRQFILSG